ncbi:hypothetical protein [Gulosibacter sp. 10]|uniref:hypothetical protein n=1 Tax=Gulosibacter sp. 10 TaxID=1255570 RepID=UPI00097E9773|nr:hypothetical protein [Gulosibacter sp. 10]SJM49137.1 hypothetical protein FM112_00890 [Gulosibacter sp. 10]
MTASLRMTMQLWRQRRDGEEAPSAGYRVYSALLGLVVLGAPAARGLWLMLEQPETRGALAAFADPTLLIPVAGAALLCALAAGSVRGPVVFAPFVAHVLGEGPLPRWRIALRPLLIAAAALGALGIALGALVGAAAGGASTTLIAANIATSGALPAAAMGAAIGLCLGLLVAALWLAGQAASPRGRRLLALVLIGATTAAAWSAGRMLVLSTTDALPLLAVLAAATVLMALTIPPLLRRLRTETIVGQSRRWQAARGLATHLELSQAAGLYGERPGPARRIGAVRGIRPLALRVLVRDAVGVLRTPARALAAVAALAVSGALIALLVAQGGSLVPMALLGAAVYTALGPLTDGLRHAVDAASSTSLYGVSDGALVASHVLLPLLVGGLVLLLGGLLAAPWSGLSPLGALASLLLAASTTLLRVVDALKPPMPPVLLTPMPTPAGDLSAASRIVWALEAPLAALLLGLSAALLATAPQASAVMLVALLALLVRRWRRR